MMSETQADERRNNERVSWRCHVRLLPLALEPRTQMLGMHDVVGQDVSEGGLRVCTDRLFALRSRLLVEMESPEVPDGIQAVGAVAWISPTAKDDLWCLGIEFSDVSDLALAGIRSLLAQEEPPRPSPASDSRLSSKGAARA